MSFKRKVMAITPILCLIGYLLIGFTINEWGWSLFIFALCPIMPYVLGEKRITLSVTFIITICYLLLGFISTYFKHPLWHPGWIMFLLIPVINILIAPTKEQLKEKIRKKIYGNNNQDDDDNIYDAK